MELKVIFGLYILYQCFVPNFTLNAAPLDIKLKKKEPKHFDNFSNAKMDALTILQPKLMDASFLDLPRSVG